MNKGTTLVLGGTGKTGRRLVERLKSRGVPVRVGSRSAQPAFDWAEPATWEAALRGVEAVYISYYPDLAAPGATDAVRELCKVAVNSGVKRLVLLSGRGETEAQHCEDIVRHSGVDWTVLRASWFSQNFSESFFLEPLLQGELALPAGDVGEPFIDADDIADVAATVLSEEGHAGKLYELTGPRLISFADAVGEIAHAAGREIRYTKLTGEAFNEALHDASTPPELIAFLAYLFDEVLDGRNAFVTDGVRQVLGRPARDFSDYARETAAQGVWNAREGLN